MRRFLRAEWLVFLMVVLFTAGCSKKADSDKVILTETEIYIEPETEPIIIEAFRRYFAGLG